MSEWQLRVAGPAQRHLAQLPDRVATAVAEFILGPLRDEPHRVGKPLQRELTSYHSARRGAYRVIYRIDEATSTIDVVHIDHRSRVCRVR
ncbi:MAG: type II toxin-antitoxin system RelE/ParE family toxin [Microthrixaceae bacterium]|nr:type II toxin-antitoxin system RelE/ParE family toxin [Microthrixaceae bacterium]